MSNTTITDEMVKNFIAQEHAPVNIPYVIERWEEFKSQHSSSGREAFNWVVFTNERLGFDTWSPKDWRGGKGKNWGEAAKTFLTKDEADTFVLMNKPCLSVNDIDEILAKEIRERKTVSKDSFREIWYTVKQLAQSKINSL